MKMKIKRYRMDQLEEARKLQESCIKNHLPCPPVSWWQAEVKNDDKIEEKIECKCNSYTRNGLNLIATAALFLPESIRSSSMFSDGYISYKDINNTILTSNYWYGYRGDAVTMVLGGSNSPSSIDICNIERPSGLIDTGATLKNVIFDNESRKLHSYLQKTFINDSNSNITIWESGVHFIPKHVYSAVSGQNSHVLVVRDVFPEPIILQPGKHLTFTYHFELLYPE